MPRLNILTPSGVASSSTSAPRRANRPFGDDADDLVDAGLEFGGVLDAEAMNVEYQIAVVREEALAQPGLSSSPSSSRAT